MFHTYMTTDIIYLVYLIITVLHVPNTNVQGLKLPCPPGKRIFIPVYYLSVQSEATLCCVVFHFDPLTYKFCYYLIFCLFLHSKLI